MGMLKQTRTKTARSLRLLALTTVLDDLADHSVTASPSPFNATPPPTVTLDSLLQVLSDHAGVSDSACVCALVYLGRVDAGVCPDLALTHENVQALLIAALAISAAYVDRRHPAELARSIAHAVKIPENVVTQLRDALVQSLDFQTYISIATFREYDNILDDIIDICGGFNARVDKIDGPLGGGYTVIRMGSGWYLSSSRQRNSASSPLRREHAAPWVMLDGRDRK